MVITKEIKQIKIHDKCVVYSVLNFERDEEDSYRYEAGILPLTYVLYEKKDIITLYKITGGGYGEGGEISQVTYKICKDFKFTTFEDAQEQIEAYFGAMAI